MYCYFVLVRSGTIYGLNVETACLIFHGLALLTMKLMFSISNLRIPAHFLKSEKELNYNRFVDPNILGASRLVHSDLRIYLIWFFPLDWSEYRLVFSAMHKHHNPFPENTRRCPNVGLMLDQRRKRWATIGPTPRVCRVNSEKKRRWPNAVLMLIKRRRRWTNIKEALGFVW